MDLLETDIIKTDIIKTDSIKADAKKAVTAETDTIKTVATETDTIATNVNITGAITTDKIIDMHAHIFPEKIAEKAVESISNYYGVTMAKKGTVKDLIVNGSRINVYKYLVHSTATKVEQVRSINNFIAAEVKANNCFIGFGTLHKDLEDVESEVSRIMKLGLKGIKLHPEFQEFNIDDEDMLPIYRAVEGKLPILIHMGDENKTSSSPRRLLKILDLFPKLTFIAAHFGGYTMWDEAMECLIGKNLYLDTSSSLYFLNRSRVLEIINKHGADKIFFGSDYPMWDHVEELERFNQLELNQSEREMILYKNAAKLLNIV